MSRRLRHTYTHSGQTIEDLGWRKGAVVALSSQLSRVSQESMNHGQWGPLVKIATCRGQWRQVQKVSYKKAATTPPPGDSPEVSYS